MNEKELREYLASLTKEQLVAMLVGTLENEKELRKELDRVRGIIR